MIVKLWVDDIRPAPKGFKWVKSVNAAIEAIKFFEMCGFYDDDIEVISIDHDAGDYAKDGGDYIKILDWLEATHRNYPIHIHSMNPVGVTNMRRIIEKNEWREI